MASLFFFICLQTIIIFYKFFKINNDLLTKDHITSFEYYDSRCNIRLAPKLTYAHIYPGSFEKIGVCLAAQVFGCSVAAGMSIALTYPQIVFYLLLLY